MYRRLDKAHLFLVLQKTLVFVLLLVLMFFDFVPFLEFSPKKVEAATGDFSVFREQTSTEEPATDGTPLDVTWDTTVSQSSNIALDVNASDIALTDGGKYLVMYNVQTNEGASGGANRRNFHTSLALNGTELEYGHGGGYLRDNDGLTEAYMSGAAIIDAAASDDLVVRVARDDGNTGAAAEIRDATNGVSVLKIPDTWDYLRLHSSATSSDLNSTSFTDLTWDTEDEQDTTNFAFTPTSADISLLGDADQKYIVTVNARLFADATTNTRQNYDMRLTLDGVEVPGTRVSAYIRGNQNGGIYYNTLSYVGLISKSLAATQTLNVEVVRESTSGTTVYALPDQTAISMVAIPDTAEVIRLLDNDGTQHPDNTRADMNWDTQLEVDGTAFDHSLVTDTNHVTIKSPGDYLFFSSMYATTAAPSNERQPFRVDWEENDVLTNYGGFGSLVRSTGGANSGGASGGLILPDLALNDTVSLSFIDESNDPSTDIAFASGYSAVQGIALNDNFFGLDVLVSASGTHAVETEIGMTDVYAGGTFVVQEQSGTRNVTSMRFTESGTVDAKEGLSNVELWYDEDTTLPYDCTGESYDGDETQFGGPGEFSGPDGTLSFSDTVEVTTTKSLCTYVVYDVVASSSDSQTVQFSIETPSADVIASGGPKVGPSNSLAPSASTTIRDAELTLTHYHWRNDDGSETAATSLTSGVEDTPVSGFTDTITRRLRMQVSSEGSTSSTPVRYRLDYAEKLTTCEVVNTWTDIGIGDGGIWDLFDTPNFVNESDSTNISVANGGVTDEGTTFVTPNSAMLDTINRTPETVLDPGDFMEIEFAIRPTASAVEGTTYCFRLSDQGNALRSYDVFPEATVSADVTVSASGAHTASATLGDTNVYLGGTFIITPDTGPRNLTELIVTETGTVDAQANLSNVTIRYDLDTSNPFTCDDQSYAGTDLVYGTLDSGSFSGANGTTSFTQTLSLDTNNVMCAYVELDVGSGAVNGETILVELSDPSSDVVVTSSSVGPSTSVAPTGSTTVSGPILTQTHYHWRTDNGTEATASSTSGGVEDTAIIDIAKETTVRVRLQVSNEGLADSASVQYVLEYGTKVTTCENISNWINVGATGGAFDMSLSSNVADGNTTDIDDFGLGAMTEENTTFVGTGALRETTATSSAITLTSTQFTELEYSIEPTVDAGDDTDYCFRVTGSDTDLNEYDVYAELSTRPKQDFFVQRGTVMVSGTSHTLVAGVDYIAPSASSAAFIRITNSQMTGAGNDTGGGNTPADDVTAYFSNPENIESSITITRPATAANNTRVSWEILEFIGLSGTDNEMIVRDHGTITYGATALTATGTAVTGVSDDADVVVFITGQLSPGVGTGDYNVGISTASWSPTSSQPVFERGDDGSLAAQLSYAVVEFTGVNWSVQRSEHVYTAAGVAEVESIDPVASINSAFIHAQKRLGAGLTGLDEYGHQVHLSSVGQVTYQLYSTAGTPSDHVSVAWVIENMQVGTGALTVYRSNGTITSGGTEPESNSVPIGATVNIANTSIFVTNDGSGNGTAFPRTILGATILSETNYELWNSDTGQNQAYRTEVIEWPVAEVSIRQNYYRFYVDNDALDPTDPWPVGVSDLGENTSITGSDDPVGETDVFRIRMSLLINNASVPQDTTTFKLQYGLQDTTCSAIGTWSDVDDINGSDRWRGYNTSVTDGTALSIDPPAVGALNLSVSDIAGTYENENVSATNPFTIDIGEDIEYDWVVEHNGATQLSDYCFRMVYSDGTELDGYDNYPTVRTSGFTPVVSDWRWYDDSENITPSTPLAAENVAPSNVTNENEIKLRITAAEVEGAPGENVKFGLQYSEYSDFSDGGTFLTATNTCLANSLWCYIDAAGIDNATIVSALLTDSESCVAGVGTGCGTHNEATSTGSMKNQGSLERAEYEFALKSAGPRAGAVYYFRLYDMGNDVPVGASSSYPSIIAGDGTLSLTVNGVSASTVTEGVTTDVTTSSTSLAFGSLPFDTEFQVGHRIEVSTNATEGYQTFLVFDQELTSTVGASIPSVTGTNASPLSWAAGCLAAATGCFGYHAGDDLLAGGSTRFGADDTYAGVSVTPEEIMYSSIPGNESHDIIYKIQVGESQPAGEYESAVMYIAVPVF